ncbi:MAG: hypothetical protein IT267_12605 [Saprospiraceae bacterium]|nr:hypothetical protein [Saprospiraceae bacterium]
MKSQIKFKTYLTLLFICLLNQSCKNEIETEDPIVPKNADQYVSAPTDKPFGKTYVEWTVEWWKKFMTQSCDQIEQVHTSDKSLFHTTGPVWFLAGINTLNATINLSVPSGKSLLLPLINYINDYPCPDTSYKPRKDQSLSDFLIQGVNLFVDSMVSVTSLEVSIDGLSVSKIPTYRFVSDLFYFQGNKDLANCIDPCITGDEQAAAAGGYFVIIKDLPVGDHLIKYHSSLPVYNYVQDATFRVRIY